MANELSATDPEWTRSALLTIDMQQDFALASGPAYVAGTEEIVGELVRTLAAFRAARRPIIHAVRYYQPDGSDAELGRRLLVKAVGGLVTPGATGAELIESLRPQDYPGLDAELLLAGAFQALGESEWAMFKPRWSAFFGTGLHAWLRSLDVSTLVVCGCNLPNCPRATIFDASSLDYRVALVAQATSQVSTERLEDLARIDACTLTQAQVERSLRELTPPKAAGGAA